jgi:hypothetical protein
MTDTVFLDSDHARQYITITTVPCCPSQPHSIWCQPFVRMEIDPAAVEKEGEAGQILSMKTNVHTRPDWGRSKPVIKPVKPRENRPEAVQNLWGPWVFTNHSHTVCHTITGEGPIYDMIQSYEVGG